MPPDGIASCVDNQEMPSIFTWNENVKWRQLVDVWVHTHTHTDWARTNSLEYCNRHILIRHTIIHVDTHNRLLPTPTLPAVSYLFAHIQTHTLKRKPCGNLTAHPNTRNLMLCFIIRYLLAVGGKFSFFFTRLCFVSLLLFVSNCSLQTQAHLHAETKTAHNENAKNNINLSEC